MIRIKCDKCDQTIELPTGIVGQKVTCPHCGDVNVLRGASGPEAKPDRAAEAGYPPAFGPEVEVLHVRPAVFRARPGAFLLLLLIAIGGFAGAALIMMGTLGAGTPVAVASASVGGLAVLWLLIWRLKKLGEGLRITTKRTIDREGFFSRTTSEVLHADIKNVQIKQSMWQRVLGVGTIAISTAAENEDEISMRDVPGPDRVRNILDLYRPM